MAVLLSYSSCKLELATLEGWIPQTTLGWNQETQAGSCKRVGVEKIYEDRDLPHDHSLLYEWFLSMNILLSFPFTSGVPCLHG